MPAAPNPLSELTWGRAPASPRRRRAALGQVFFPAIYYCVILGFMLGTEAWNRIRRGESLLAQNWSENLLLYVSLAGFIVVPSLLLMRVSLRSQGQRLRDNWADYRMIGLSGRQMLRGVAGPGLLGVFLAALVHLLLFSGGLAVYRMQIGLQWSNDDWWLMGLLAASLCVILTSAATVEVALWAYTADRLPRTMAVLAFFFASPLLYPLFMNSNSANTLRAAAQAEILFLILKLFFARWIWRRACARLERESIEP